MNLDPNGEFKYNQLKGIISPKVSCNVNSVCCAYECKNKEWPIYIKNYHKELPRVPDKLIYFLRNEPMIKEMYKFIYPELYNKWIKDKTKDKDLYSDNSIPPNEIIKILCIGFNIFMNMNQLDTYKNYCAVEFLTIDEIKKNIEKGNPIVSSFNLNGYGHIMTTIGFDKKNMYVEDSYGMSYLKNHQDIGSAKIISEAEYKKICKPINEEKKLVIVF